MEGLSIFPELFFDKTHSNRAHALYAVRRDLLTSCLKFWISRALNIYKSRLTPSTSMNESEDCESTQPRFQILELQFLLWQTFLFQISLSILASR